jgi:hypothetical protein
VILAGEYQYEGTTVGGLPSAAFTRDAKGNLTAHGSTSFL